MLSAQKSDDLADQIPFSMPHVNPGQALDSLSHGLVLSRGKFLPGRTVMSPQILRMFEGTHRVTRPQSCSRGLCTAEGRTELDLSAAPARAQYAKRTSSKKVAAPPGPARWAGRCTRCHELCIGHTTRYATRYTNLSGLTWLPVPALPK